MEDGRSHYGVMLGVGGTRRPIVAAEEAWAAPWQCGAEPSADDARELAFSMELLFRDAEARALRGAGQPPSRRSP